MGFGLTQPAPFFARVIALRIYLVSVIIQSLNYKQKALNIKLRAFNEFKTKNRIILKFTSSSIQTLTVGAVVSTAQSG
jgi:hypothetical protein